MSYGVRWISGSYITTRRRNVRERSTIHHCHHQPNGRKRALEVITQGTISDTDQLL